jgi:transcriptional regulator with XRE-family HTH domain
MAKTETLAGRLRRLREDAGLTQQALADATGESVWNIRNWENGHRIPGLHAAYKLARELRVPMEQLGECAAAEKKPQGGRRKPGAG